MSDKYKKLSKEELLRLVEKQEEELKTKKYGLAWDSEREPEQVVLDCEENLPILERAEEKEVKKYDSNDNILIEGDNYHALTVLNYTHKDSIDVIYIDPPYNTGKSDEWKYNDKYVDENDGYRHSKWLNFMGKRLKLAKKLLTKDGVIFISIGRDEFSQLKLICDKIFGESNFITNFIWEKTQHFGRQKINFYQNVDYILSYAKNIRNQKLKELLVENKKEEHDDAPLYNASNPVNTLTFPAGSVLFNIPDGKYDSSKNKKYKLLDSVVVKDSKNKNSFRLRFKSRWSQRKIDREIKKGSSFWVKSEGFAIRVIYTEEKVSTNSPKQIIFTNKNNSLCVYNRMGEKVGTNEDGSRELTKIVGEQNVFEYPKPVSLIKYLISLIYDHRHNKYQNKLTVLDFFAGSGTTGQAVLELNKEDNGKRKFILCTNNEVSADEEKKFKKEHDLNDSKFKKWQKENKKEWLDFQEENGICSAVCYPRIKKVIEGYDYEGKEKELVWEKDFTLNTLRWDKADEIYQEYEKKRKEIKEKYDDYKSSFENNVIRLYGVKEVKGKKEGLGGNLQYFKTSFVKKTKNSDQLKLNLTQKCTQMLCVKENIYNLEKEEEEYKIFSSNKKDMYLFVYYNFVDDSFDKFLKDLEKIKEEKKIYMFSTDNEVDKNLFESLENFNIEPIPQPILDIYRQLIRLNIKDK